MDTIRIMYRFYEQNWMADSPDFEALAESVLVSGGATYEEARTLMVDGVPWWLEREDVVLEHFVHEDSLPKLLAERQAAEAQQAVAPTTR
jgi:hypothetical protein